MAFSAANVSAWASSSPVSETHDCAAANAAASAALTNARRFTRSAPASTTSTTIAKMATSASAVMISETPRSSRASSLLLTRTGMSR